MEKVSPKFAKMYLVLGNAGNLFKDSGFRIQDYINQISSYCTMLIFCTYYRPRKK